MPILLIILGAILQFAFIFGAQIGITNAVREAARNAAAAPTANGTLAAANGHATYVQLTDAAGGLLAKNVQSYLSGQLVTSGSPITEVCYAIYTDPANTTQVKVKVEAYYRHPLFIPLIGAILSSDNALQIGASEEMRVENPPSTTAPTLGSPPGSSAAGTTQCVTS